MTTKKDIPYILLVEDDELIASSLETGLTNRGFRIKLAKNGRYAMEFLKNEIPDLVLLDIVMPEVNGFEVLQHMKMRADCCKVPVIVLSNLSTDIDMNKAREMGADNYIVKSNYSLSELVKKIKACLEKKK